MMLPYEIAKFANVTERDVQDWVHTGLPRPDGGYVRLDGLDLHSLLEFIRELDPHPGLRTIPPQVRRMAHDNPISIADPR